MDGVQPSLRERRGHALARLGVAGGALGQAKVGRALDQVNGEPGRVLDPNGLELFWCDGVIMGRASMH